MEFVMISNKRMFKCVLLQVFNILVIFFIYILIQNKALSNPTTPSQALPDLFKTYNKPDFYKLRKAQKIVPVVPKPIKNNETDKIIDPTLKIIPESIVILAPKLLQNVIDFDKYKNELIGKDQSISNIHDVANKLTNEFNEKGFPLVRVIVPSQELDIVNATIFFKVIDGKIEKLDLRNVPANQAARIYSYLKPLINKDALTLKEINRRLILAGSITGISLNSGFLPGETSGGTKLVVEATHKYISGNVEFNNFQSKSLGRQQGQMSLLINSPFGFGEKISLFGLARPTEKGVKGSGSDVPVRGGGISITAPIDSNGTFAGISYIESMTRPGGDLQSLSLEANMKSGSVTLSHPLVYQPNKTWFLRGTINWTDEIQSTSLTGKTEKISHDRLTNLRIGTSITNCIEGCLSFDAEISRGLELFSRSASEATSIPLSRTSATSTYTHLNANVSYSRVFKEDYVVNFNSGGQYTDDSLLNSEQSSIIGEKKISSLTSGSITGDKQWYTRIQANKNFAPSNKLMFSPYVYSAMGVAYINQASATEEKSTAAKSIGIGLEFNGIDEMLFGKNISGKAEFSKTWATNNIEDLSDIRLNNNQIALKLAMSF